MDRSVSSSIEYFVTSNKNAAFFCTAPDTNESITWLKAITGRFMWMSRILQLTCALFLVAIQEFDNFYEQQNIVYSIRSADFCHSTLQLPFNIVIQLWSEEAFSGRTRLHRIKTSVLFCQTNVSRGATKKKVIKCWNALKRKANLFQAKDSLKYTFCCMLNYDKKSLAIAKATAKLWGRQKRRLWW